MKEAWKGTEVGGTIDGEETETRKLEGVMKWQGCNKGYTQE